MDQPLLPPRGMSDLERGNDLAFSRRYRHTLFHRFRNTISNYSKCLLPVPARLQVLQNEPDVADLERGDNPSFLCKRFSNIYELKLLYFILSHFPYLFILSVLISTAQVAVHLSPLPIDVVVLWVGTLDGVGRLVWTEISCRFDDHVLTSTEYDYLRKEMECSQALSKLVSFESWGATLFLKLIPLLGSVLGIAAGSGLLSLFLTMFSIISAQYGLRLVTKHFSTAEDVFNKKEIRERLVLQTYLFVK